MFAAGGRTADPPDHLAVTLGAHLLPRHGTVVVPTPATAAALHAAGVPAEAGSLDDLPSSSADALGLLDTELSRAGDHAEGLIAEAARVLRPGGLLVTTAEGEVWSRSVGAPSSERAFTATALGRMLGLAGFAVTGQWAPGAGSRITGAPECFQPETDRLPGLLDAGRLVAGAALRYADPTERSRTFFASLPRKVVAAAVICRNAQSQLLCVLDSFKDHWTIPGGIVDADEDPRAGAAREAREEAGIDVVAEDLLGLFAMSWPDRLLLVYAARPTGDAVPRPLHTHEIGAAVWLPLSEAFARLNPHTAGQVRRCLDTPGGTWHDVSL